MEKYITKIALAGFFFVSNLTGCTQAANTRKSNGEVNFDTRKDSTAYVLKGDSILPPLKYNIDQMMDYPSEIKPVNIR
jgi:uncharacterized lipoprotein YehR (DUF1307 family)